MGRTTLFCLCLIVSMWTAVTAWSEESATGQPRTREPAAKELSGMSIVGNDEAPKALYIVPWKRSEIGVETSLSMVLNDGAAPVDREVFMRQLEFYEVSTGK